MCGINGFNFKDENLIKSMNTKVAHRGPDDMGIFLDENISFGHQRLSIIDLSERAHQPMQIDNGRYTICYNGELYNFKELREELKNKYQFKSDSDTEVILYAYKEWGKGMLQKLNGIFAFAIYDKESQELFLARDRMGVKPLYYYWDRDSRLRGNDRGDDGKFIFSSEIKAILEHNITRELDMEAFNLYFHILYVPAPLTMFKGVKKLLPGHCLTLKDNQIKIERYWQINDLSNYNSYDEALLKVKELIHDSVRGQLISDRPVGVFLSGGIDSTAILGLTKKIKGGTINTYSVGFDVNEDSIKFNADRELAKRTAEYYGTNHHEVITTGQDILDYFETIVYHMDEPVSNAVQIATYLLAKRAKQDVAVVLGGDGGDEIFGGYPRYYFNYLIDNYQKYPSWLGRKYISKILGKFYKGADKKFELEGVDRWMEFMIQEREQVAKILRPNVISWEKNREFYKNRFFSGYPKTDFTKYFMAVDTENWLADESLLRSDKMTMAHGLEQRVPILDHRLVEIAMKIPTKWKMGDRHQGKKIWIDAVEEFLPDFVRQHPKHGFFSPGAKWLRGELKDFAYEIFNNLDETLFNREEAIKMLDDHIEKRKYNLNLIWAILTWQVWYNKFIKRI